MVRMVNNVYKLLLRIIACLALPGSKSTWSRAPEHAQTLNPKPSILAVVSQLLPFAASQVLGVSAAEVAAQHIQSWACHSELA